MLTEALNGYHILAFKIRTFPKDISLENTRLVVLKQDARAFYVRKRGGTPLYNEW
jgi:hypothetical protein